MSLKEENLEAFKAELQKNYKSKNYTKQLIDPEIVGELAFQTISFDLVRLIEQYEPYGLSNTKPKFITSSVRIADVNTMGKEGEHLRFLFEQHGQVFTGVKFKTTEKFEIDDKVDIVYTVNENYFRGNVTLQLMVEKVVTV